MFDLTRLMYDDGATRPAEEQETYPTVLFEHMGKMWEASPWLPGDPWHGRGWSFSEVFHFSLAMFIKDPVSYAEKNWTDKYPGWPSVADPFDSVARIKEGVTVYTFREV